MHELLDLIGLPQEMAKRYPAQLSGGQRQRVGVARALAADPPLMLMDEPFGAIDPINRERLQNEFLRLQAEIRKTIVFVTHDIDEAIKMGDQIAILQVGGKLAQYATPVRDPPCIPRTSSSRTSSAPTARSSGSRCCASRDIPRALGPSNGGPSIRDSALAARRAQRPAPARRAARQRRRRRGPDASAASAMETLARGWRRRDCSRPARDPRAATPRRRASSDNGFCPDWIADNWERYSDAVLSSTSS